MMIHIGDAILSLNPLAKYHLTAPTGTDIDNATITWDEGMTPISKADIKAEMERLQVEYNALDYARARESAYPSTKDFMEAYTEKEIGGDTTKWDAYVINYNKTRSDNPK